MAKLDTSYEPHEFLMHGTRLAVAPLHSVSQKEREEARRILHYAHREISAFLDYFAPLLSLTEYHQLLHEDEHSAPIFKETSKILAHLESHLLTPKPNRRYAKATSIKNAGIER
ncbi:MAG: hypothetical protein AABX07_05335 [Nanoarchaeota archaeon]